MSDEFKPITTQEALDAIIADRVRRAKESAAKPYEELKSKVSDYEKTIGDLNARIKELEGAKAEDGTTLKELQDKIKYYETQAVKIRVAHDVGIPYDFAERLTGEDEDTIKADAENIKKFMVNRSEAPLGDPEPQKTSSDKETALYKAVADLG